ncbi:MAG: 1-acyl-sn-glycerol-3-phosphate acyltransferase [Bdellovibrionia bacterium]
MSDYTWNVDLIELVKHRRFKTLNRIWLQLLRGYFRVEVEGLENIPRKGGAIIIPNHSGFAGADALILAHVIKRETRRRARLLAHRAFFDFSKTLKAVAERFGLRKATVTGGQEMLKQGRLVILFPEGEVGNFKPTFKRYQLQPFHTGFLRMAIPNRAPIIPCVIIGAEEASLNLGNVDLSKFIKGIRIPFPVNPVPLPAKWKIRILPSIDSTEYADVLHDPDKLQQLARDCQARLQKEIRKELKTREYIYFRQTRKLVEKVFRKKRT